MFSDAIFSNITVTISDHLPDFLVIPSSYVLQSSFKQESERIWSYFVLIVITLQKPS